MHQRNQKSRLSALLAGLFILFASSIALASSADDEISESSPVAEEPQMEQLRGLVEAEAFSQSEQAWVQIHETVAPSPDFSSDIQWLKLKSRRQLASAIGLYAVSAGFVGWGIAVAAPSCGEPDSGSPSFGLCDALTDVAGGLIIGFGSVPALAAGIPLHRASARNRATMRALQSGEVSEFSRTLHRAPKLRSAGVNAYVTGAALGTASLVSVVIASTSEENSTARDRAGHVAAFTGIATGAAAIVGTGLYVRGNRLMERGLQARPVQAVVAPSFYGDGAGLSLWMGF